MKDIELGLYRFVNLGQQGKVEGSLSISFADIYDALNDVRTNTQELERVLDGILYGASAIRETD